MTGGWALSRKTLVLGAEAVTSSSWKEAVEDSHCCLEDSHTILRLGLAQYRLGEGKQHRAQHTVPPGHPTRCGPEDSWTESVELSTMVGVLIWNVVRARASGSGLTSVLQLWLLETPGRLSLGPSGPGVPL